MKYNPEIHHRQSIRLREYDYSQAGAYFITICTKDKECLFGEIRDGEMMLNEFGKIACDCVLEFPNHFKNAEVDTFVIMPNHVHTIIVITGIIDGRRGMACHAPTNKRFGKPVPNSISTMIGSFKSAVSKQINQIRNNPGVPVWQRNYYEHIIRNQTELDKIREYIIGNPMNWLDDENYKM